MSGGLRIPRNVLLPSVLTLRGADITNLNAEYLNGIVEFKVPSYSTLPAIQEQGRLIFLTSDNNLYKSDGTSWSEVGAASLPAPLLSIANLTTTADDMLYTTASDTYATTTLTSQGRALLDDTSALQQRATLGVVIGSDVQAYDDTLQNISSVVTAADQLLYTTAPDTFAATGITSFGRSLIDDASATAARTTLEAVGSGGTSTDNAIVRWDGATGYTVQDSGITIDNSDNVTGANNLDVGGNLTVTGTVAGLTQAEVSQLQNINATTISSTQWGYLGDMDQGVATASTPIFTGLGAGGQKITNLAAPTLDTDATNKLYVDTVAAAGLSPLEAAVFSSTQDLSSEGYGVVTYNGAGVGVLTPANNGQLQLDGISATLNDRVLIKDQTVQTENGVYSVTIVGNAGATWELTRVTNFQKGDSVTANTYVFVTSGTAYGNTSWTLEDSSGTGTMVVDTNNIIWDQFSAGQNLIAGDGIDIVGNTISVDGVATVFQFTAGELDVINTGLPTSRGGTGTNTLTNGNVLVGAGAGAVTTTKAAPAGDFVGTSDAQALTNKTITDATNTTRATQLATAGADVVLTAGAAPTAAGQVLTSTGVAAAGWATPVGSLARVLRVSSSGGDYTTIAAALVAASVATNVTPYIVQVGPGIYTENNNAGGLVVSSYVVLQGLAGGPSTVVVPTLTTGPLFQCNSHSAVRFISASGTSGAGGICFDFPPGTSRTFVASCIISDTETGYRIRGSGTDVTLDSCIIASSSTVTITTGISVESGAILKFAVGRIDGYYDGLITRRITTGINITGNDGTVGSEAKIASVSFNYCESALNIQNGISTTVPAKLTLLASDISASTVNAIYVGQYGRAKVFSANISATSGNDLNLDDSTASFLGNGNRLRGDRIVYTTGANLQSQSLSDKIGDEGIDIRGELHVGYYADPRESVFGGGDSHTINMYVYTEDTVGAFTDRTAAASEDDGVTFPLFDGTAAGNRCYFGLADTTITGGFPGIKVVDITTALVLGSGSLTWEYWNGAAWTTMYIMTTKSNPDYTPRATLGAFAYVESQQIRFGSTTGFGTTTVNGTLAYWARVSIATAITTIAVIDQIKLHTNRVEINGDGYMEYFGSARPTKRYPIHLTEFSNPTSFAAPGNGDVYVSDGLGIRTIEGVFGYLGPADSMGIDFDLPEDVDTSFSMCLCFKWFTDTAGGGNVVWRIRWGFTTDVSDDSGTVSDIFASIASAPATGPNEQYIDSTEAVGSVEKQYSSMISMNISDAVGFRDGSSSGDHFFLTLSRMSTAPGDTHNGSIYVYGANVRYRASSNGKFDGI